MNPFEDQQFAALQQLIELEGETVTYTPQGGAARPFAALVIRRPPRPGANAEQLPTPEIVLLNHATLGATSIDLQGDRFTLADLQGGQARDHGIVEKIGQDGASWHLALR